LNQEPEHASDEGLATPGAITYLHIPAADVRRSAAFYGDVFGWRIHNADSGRPGFEDTSGRIGGAWVTNQAVASEPGLLPYIYVSDVDQTVARIKAGGGEIVSGPGPEGSLIVATFRDPAGNVVGLWHDTTR
jgi:hypothetical protein